MKICGNVPAPPTPIQGHLYMLVEPYGNDAVRDLYICAKPGACKGLILISIIDGNRWADFSPFGNYPAERFVDVTDEYCLTKVTP